MVIGHSNSVWDCRKALIVTGNTWMQKQLLTGTITIFATSFKIIFAILCHRKVKGTKSAMGMLYRQLGILRWSVTI